jgi:BirA family transcriptional regulator, biotin operon repressor / biotin---[acetyl-CoA-carboxylase] ligase
MVSNLHHVAQTASTNSDAMALANGGADLPLWVIADEQTSGKGRSGRTWVSLPGNFHASFAVQLTCELAKAGQIALVAGVAVIDAIEAAWHEDGQNDNHPYPDFRLKWPNDIMGNDAKCGGILIESTPARGRVGLHGVIGIGLNLVGHPADLDRSVTNFAAMGQRIKPLAFLSHLDLALKSALALWDAGHGFERVRERWLSVGTPIGTAMSVQSGSRRVDGEFAGLNCDGALLLRDASGSVATLTFGDVTLNSAPR